MNIETAKSHAIDIKTISQKNDLTRETLDYKTATEIMSVCTVAARALYLKDREKHNALKIEELFAKKTIALTLTQHKEKPTSKFTTRTIQIWNTIPESRDNIKHIAKAVLRQRRYLTQKTFTKERKGWEKIGDKTEKCIVIICDEIIGQHIIHALIPHLEPLGYLITLHKRQTIPKAMRMIESEGLIPYYLIYYESRTDDPYDFKIGIVSYLPTHDKSIAPIPGFTTNNICLKDESLTEKLLSLSKVHGKCGVYPPSKEKSDILNKWKRHEYKFNIIE